jgi:hypothetical protein
MPAGQVHGRERSCTSPAGRAPALSKRPGSGPEPRTGKDSVGRKDSRSSQVASTGRTIGEMVLAAFLASAACLATPVHGNVVRAGPFVGYVVPLYDVVNGRFRLHVGEYRNPATGLSQKIPWFIPRRYPVRGRSSLSDDAWALSGAGSGMCSINPRHRAIRRDGSSHRASAHPERAAGGSHSRVAG